MREPHRGGSETDGDVPPQLPCPRCLYCQKVTPNKDLSDRPTVDSYAEPALCDLSTLLGDTEPLKPLPLN